jgi:hypothetical protein
MPKQIDETVQSFLIYLEQVSISVLTLNSVKTSMLTYVLVKAYNDLADNIDGNVKI